MGGGVVGKVTNSISNTDSILLYKTPCCPDDSVLEENVPQSRKQFDIWRRQGVKCKKLGWTIVLQGSLFGNQLYLFVILVHLD